MRTLLQELRVAVRSLARRPAFSITAVLTLALGLGATLAIFTLVHGIVLRPLPYPASERIVEVRHHAPGMDLPNLNNSPGTLRFYRAHGDRLFSALAAYRIEARNAVLGDRPDRIPVLYGTAGLWEVLEIRPALGRAFTADEAHPDVAPVALLTHGTWTRHFGQDPTVVGRTIDIEGRPTEIIGVMSRGFDFHRDGLALVAPLHVDPDGQFGAFGTDAIGRLRGDLTLADATVVLDDLQTLLPGFMGDEDLTPEFLESVGWSASIRTLRDSLVSGSRTGLWVVLGSVVFLLLVACANVANLFMVRAETQRRPTAVRSALGASRWRIGWGVLAETIPLTLAGTAVGAGLAWAAIRWITGREVADLPRLNEVTMDTTTVVVAASLAVLVSLILAALPFLRLDTTDVADRLRGDGRTTTGGRDAQWTRDLLVSLQLAAALVLVVGSGLLFRSFVRLQAVDPGFDPQGVTIAGISRNAAEDPGEALTSLRVLMERLEALPGIEQVAFTSGIPFLEGSVNGGSFYIESRPREDDELPPVSMNKSMTDRYLSAMGMRVVEGRPMRPGDGEDGRPVLWVNETFARRFMDGQALGERVREDESAEWGEIVGVVSDAREFGLNSEVRPMMYLPAALHDWGPSLGLARVVLVIKGIMPSPDIARAVHRIMGELDPGVPVLSVRPLEEGISESLAQRRYTTIVVGLAGVAALLLGVVGLFGVISYVVSQRQREIGVRMALGAEKRDVERLFLRKGAKVCAFGIVLGLIGAALLSRVLGSALFEISTTDPLTFVTAPLVLAGVALLGTWLPARKAARLDPMTTLRAE